MSELINTGLGAPAASEGTGDDMHIHKPKAAHGVREFLSEISVIVVGILIALAGEQVVERLEWRHKVEAAEAAMRTELVQDDGPQAYHRLAQSPCIAAQLDALERGLIEERDHGTPFRPAPLIKPFSFTWDQNAWQSAQASGTTAHMNDKQMLNWAAAYGLFPAMNSFQAREEADYAELASVAITPPHPSEYLRDRLISIIYRARDDNASLQDYGGIFIKYSRKAGLSMTEAEKRSALNGRTLTFVKCSKMIEP